MKFMVMALALIGSLAQAETLHTCVLTSQPKARSSSSAVTKTVYLANGRMSFVRVSEATTLKFMLAHVGANADVYVNDQLGFIFKGDITKGSFESAWDQGTIACDAGQEVGAIYISAGGFGPTRPAGAYTILGSCYAGDSKAVAKDLVKIEGFQPSAISVDAVSGEVRATRTEKQCIDGEGTNPDDYVCHKYGKVKVTYRVSNCDYDPNERP